MLTAKRTQDNEAMEAALVSFYGNRYALQEKGVDEAAMNGFDKEVDVILKMKAPSQNRKVKETMRSMQYDVQNILKAKSTQNNEDMETALHSFYRNRKTLKGNGVDVGVMKEFDDTVEAILKKPGVGQGKKKKGVTKTLESINQDLKNMMKARSTQDNEYMEAALVSFYGNRKTLEDKDVDENILRDFDEKVNVILGMNQLPQHDKVKETMINMQYDMQNIVKAKSNQNNEDMESALHSFYINRKTLKENGADEGVMKEFSDAVDAVLKKSDVGLGKRKDGIKRVMESINQDLNNILEAKNSDDAEDMEAALLSFYGNRKTLEEEDADENIVRDFDERVNDIREMKQLSQDDKVKETMRNMQYDMQNIIKAKNNQDNEDMEAALHSFYGNRKTLKDNGADEGVVKEFSDAVDVILKK